MLYIVEGLVLINKVLKSFLAVVVFFVIILVVISFAGVRIQIKNSTNHLLKNIEINLKSKHTLEQSIKIADIQKQGREAVVFDSKHEVEFIELTYEYNGLQRALLPVYIEIGSPMYIEVEIFGNGKAKILNSKPLLFSIDIVNIVKNYIQR